MERWHPYQYWLFLEWHTLCGLSGYSLVVWSPLKGFKHTVHPGSQSPWIFSVETYHREHDAHHETIPQESYPPRDLDGTDLSSEMPWGLCYSANGLYLHVLHPIPGLDSLSLLKICFQAESETLRNFPDQLVSNLNFRHKSTSSYF